MVRIIKITNEKMQTQIISNPDEQYSIKGGV